MGDKIRLLPCPFCGNTRPALEWWGGAYVDCAKCEAEGPAVRVEGDLTAVKKGEASERAVQNWNRRVAIDEAARDRLAELAADLSDLAETVREAATPPAPEDGR